MDFKLGQRLRKEIIACGFAEYKDVLGVYYSKTTHKVSIMKHAHMYMCFYNVNKDNQWILVAKAGPFLDYNQALNWTLDKCKKAL